MPSRARGGWGEGARLGRVVAAILTSDAPSGGPVAPRFLPSRAPPTPATLHDLSDGAVGAAADSLGCSVTALAIRRPRSPLANQTGEAAAKTEVARVLEACLTAAGHLVSLVQAKVIHLLSVHYPWFFRTVAWERGYDSLMHNSVGPLLPGRRLDTAAFGHHVHYGEALRQVDLVVSALTAVAALPVELDLLTVGAFSEANLARLVDVCNDVSRMERLRVALDVSVTADGLAVVGQLPTLTCLCILVTDEKCVGCFIQCPILGLTHLGVSMSPGVRPQYR